MNLVEEIVTTMTQIVQHFGPLMGFFIIVLESIIPILPLAVFIGLNVVAFGTVFGFVLSWFATICGSMLSFYIFRKGFSKWIYKKTKIDGKVHYFMNYISKVRFSQLVLIIALPFTPAFAVNIAGGLSKIPVKKFLLAAIIGKISIVYFWGWIGTNFVESIYNPSILIKIGIMLVIVYVVSLIIQKILKIAEA